MYFLLGSPSRLDFGDRRHQVALVDDRDAERGQPLAEPGDAERGRPHVDAAAVAAEIERHADDVDGTAWLQGSTRHRVRTATILRAG